MIRRTKHFYEFGPFRIDIAERLLLRNGEPVPLTPKVLDTLLALVENSGHILTKDELMRMVWTDTIVEEANLTRNISVLRKVLGEGPNENQYIETIPWRGYRFVGSVQEVSDEPADLIIEEHIQSRIVVEQERETAPSGRQSLLPGSETGLSRGSVKETRWRLAAGAAVLVLAIGALIVWTINRSDPEAGAVASSSATSVRRLAVLPFRSLGPEAGDEYLEIGLADTLITRLSRINQLIVLPLNAVRKFAGENQDTLAVARGHRVDAVLEGSIHKSGGRIRVTARLISTKDGSALWAGSFDERYEDILGLQDSIVERLAGALTLRLTGDEQKLLTKRYTDSAQAHQLYLRGRYHWDKWTRMDTKKSVEYFQQAISLDPEYALAYTGLADAYSALNGLGGVLPRDVMPKAKAAVARALEIDDTLAEAHTALGLIKHFYDWDFEGGDGSFQRAIALNPNSAAAHHLYGKNLPDTGRFEEAVEKLKRALELDPYSVGINKDLGEVLYYARRYDRAVEQFQKTLELEPKYAMAYFWLSRVYEAQGLYDLAIDAHLGQQTASGMSEDEIARWREVYSRLGWKGYWWKQLELTKQRTKGTYHEPYLTVWLYLRLDDKERALQWLEEAYRIRSPWMPTITYDPLLDGLRSDPRFQSLQRRIGPAR